MLVFALRKYITPALAVIVDFMLGGFNSRDQRHSTAWIRKGWIYDGLLYTTNQPEKNGVIFYYE